MVTFEHGPLAERYVRETDLRWPILVDESRALYLAYGMERGRWWDIYGPSTWRTYFNLLAKGRRLQTSQGDVNQLGGDVLITPEGNVHLHYIGSGPSDRPPVDSLLNYVRNPDY